jgi:GlcNAc-P-P-Und epimerase
MPTLEHDEQRSDCQARLLDAPAAIVDRQVFYVGDETIDLWEWTNGFSLALRGRAVLVVPRPIVRGIARVGDVVIALGGRFPLFSSRYRSMTEDYATPMQRTFDRLGMPELKLADGIEETVSWLKSQGEFWR